MSAFDLDNSLLAGSQESRDKVMLLTSNPMYATARSKQSVLQKINQGLIALPKILIGKNGAIIYYNSNSELHEAANWSSKIDKIFNREHVVDVLENISKRFMFDKSDIPKELQHNVFKEQRGFNGSKIAEFRTHDGIAVSLIFPPDLTKAVNSVVRQELEDNKIKADIHSIYYPIIGADKLKVFEKFHSPEISLENFHYSKLRYDKNDGINILQISPIIDKGAATEFIRKESGFRPEEVLAAGDAINDLSMANKGYHFALLQSYDTPQLEKELQKLSNSLKARIICPRQKGADGILETIA